MKTSKIIPPVIIVSGFVLVIAIIWEQEFKHYVPTGNRMDLSQKSTLAVDFLSTEKPSYLHFFSEECRNARINLTHIERIIEDYKDQVNFYIINGSSLDSRRLKEKYNLPHYVQVKDDAKGLIARSLQVKTSPYALIATENKSLFFGGNYQGKNGLCGANEITWSSPAVALKFLLEQKQPPLFPSHQLDFIGCGI